MDFTLHMPLGGQEKVVRMTVPDRKIHFHLKFHQLYVSRPDLDSVIQPSNLFVYTVGTAVKHRRFESPADWLLATGRHFSECMSCRHEPQSAHERPFGS